MKQEIYLVHLNRFFHCKAGAIIENGGEILRFIGDAVLAIFPIAGETSKSWKTQLELWKPTGGPLKRQRLFPNA